MQMYNNNSSFKSDEIVSIAICTILFYSIITNFINILLNFIVPANFIYDTIICYAVALIICARGLFIKGRNGSYLISFVSFLILLIIYIATMILFPQNFHLMFTNTLDINNPFYRLFIFCFPCFVLFLKLTDIDIFVKTFTKFSYFASFSLIIKFFLFPASFYVNGAYMVFSYDLLVPTSFLYSLFFTQKNKFAACVALLSSIIIFISGARGALLCLGVVIVLLIIMNTFKSLKQTMKVFTIISGVIFLVAINFGKIISGLSSFLATFNIRSRTIDLILSQEFFNQSGRDVLAQTLLEYIKNNVFIGAGLYGDMAVTVGIFSNEGSYAHNIFIELLVQFGMIVGITIFISIIALMLYSFLKNKNKLVKSLIIVFSSSGFIKLFFSASYLQEPFFWALIGFCIFSINYSKHQQVFDKIERKTQE